MSEPTSFWGHVAAWAWTQREEILRTLKDLTAWFRSASPRESHGRGIVVLGIGGTGKTTLARLLAGQYEPLFDAVEEYEESLRLEEYALEDDPSVAIVVPPGQSHRREATWNNLLAAIARGEYRGVILVSAYGYGSPGVISADKIREFQGDPDQALPEFLRRQQDDEIRVLQRVLDHVGRSGRPTWLLSVITKQDLWWSVQRDVEYHYTEGRFGKLVKSFLASVDRQKLRYETVLVSLTIRRFQTGRHELLQNNVAGYDHSLHFGSQRRLFEIVNALREWERET